MYRGHTNVPREAMNVRSIVRVALAISLIGAPASAGPWWVLLLQAPHTPETAGLSV
jgi:hypothetical protein